YAKKVGTVYRILSAKYGLLHPDYRIHQYDVTFNRPGDPVISPEALAEQIQRQRLHENYDRVIVVAGKEYVDRLRAAAPDLKIETPFEGKDILHLPKAIKDATARAEQNPDAKQYEPDILEMTEQEAHKHLRGMAKGEPKSEFVDDDTSYEERKKRL